MEEPDKKILELTNDPALASRYQYVKRISFGGMAVVHELWDPYSEESVALKVLREDFQLNRRALARFWNEARNIEGKSHPNIVEVYGWRMDSESKSYYILMEYIDNGTLSGYIDNKFQNGVDPRVSIKDQLREIHYFLQICEALSYLEEFGIIIRDLKPDNILVRKDDMIKLSDFGIMHLPAKQKLLSPDPLTTDPDAELGTPRYMSPEQVTGSTVTGKSDIYSLGTCLYELLIAKTPFVGKDHDFVRNQQVHCSPVPPREINKNIHPGLENIALRCLEKDPNLRPSPAEVKHELKAIQEAYIYNI